MHKPIIKKFKKGKVHLPFIDNISGADLADIKLINKFIKETCFLLWVIDIFTNYARVISLKDKAGITITNVFQKVIDESNRKPNKIWVDKGSKFYNKSMKSWLKQKNALEMFSRHKKRKSAVTERFIRISKNKFINT